MNSSTKTLVESLRILARDIQSDDGVANAAIAEAADRLELLESCNADLARIAKERNEALKQIKWLEEATQERPAQDAGSISE